MNIHYDLEKLDQIARDLFGLLHLAILITDYNGNRLVKCTDPCDFCSTLQAMDPGLHDACHQSDKALMAQCRQTSVMAISMNPACRHEHKEKLQKAFSLKKP